MFKLKAETNTEENKRIQGYFAEDEILGIQVKIQSILVASRPNTLTHHYVWTIPIEILH